MVSGPPLSARAPRSVVLAVFVALPVAVTLALSAAIALAQTKEAMHARMLDLARQMDALKPSLASNLANAHSWSLLMEEYRRISESLGGDDPAKAIAGPFAAAPSAPVGTAADPQGCGGVNITFTNTTNVVIPTGPAVVSSTILVTDAGPFLWDLDVQTRITHTQASDLDITLTSPQGTVVTLTTDNGGGSDDVFDGTIWDDQANPGGQLPYNLNNGLATDQAYFNTVLASPLVPEEALGAFRGENPNGTWTLRISDDAATDGGVLDEWTLFLEVFPAAPLENTHIIVPNNTPVPIPPGPAVVSSNLEFTLTATICGVQAFTDIDHTFSADLDITLRSPAGTVSTLTTDNGFNHHGVFAGTFWNDYADPDGQVPYVSNANLTTDHPYADLMVATPLVPEEAASAFLGEEAAGTWTLTISDDVGGAAGTLQSWSVRVYPCVCAQSVTPRRADARASGGASNVNNVVEPGERFVYEGRWVNAGPAFRENFEQIIPPGLPSTWSTFLAVGQPGDLPWRTTSTTSHSQPNSALAAGPGHVTDNRLHTPSVSIDRANRFLDFKHFFDFETNYDGGVLEVSVGGGAFQDIVTAGGIFFGNGYAHTISGGTGNPISGRMAWSGNSGGFVRTIVILPDSMLGDTVVFRFRAATDESNSGGPGWVVDSVALGGIVDATLAATTNGLLGPGPASYTLNDGTADYGTMPPGVSNNCFDATGDCYEFTISNPGVRPGLHWDAFFSEITDTGSNGSQSIHVGNSFTDVTVLGNPYYRFIETLLHLGITGGCDPTTYCPASNVLREQMAVFLLVAKFGFGYTPPPCVAQFGDVPCSNPFAAWINELFNLGITGGCAPGMFCPGNPVLREQMAVFLLVAFEGAGYMPPACTTPLFGDVPCSSIYARWINELSRRGITGGCGGGNFCPGTGVTREQMAVFLTVAFALQLY